MVAKWAAVLVFLVFLGRLVLYTDFAALVQSEGDGMPSISRFQMLFWTATYGFAFLYMFITEEKLPQFSATDLSLLGLGSGVYLGAKALANKGAAARAAAGSAAARAAAPAGEPAGGGPRSQPAAGESPALPPEVATAIAALAAALQQGKDDSQPPAR